MIRVLLVDDQNFTRAALKSLLALSPDIEIVGEADSGTAALRLLKTISPDIILMDLNLPGMSGLRATRVILERNPNAKIIALTTYAHAPIPTKMLQAGAKGYLTKSSSLEELINAIQSVFDGKIYLSADISHQIAISGVSTKASPLKSLSGRELQVLTLIIQGHTAQEIGDKLSINHKTVNSFRYRIYRKLDLKNNVELTLFAARYGLLEKIPVSF